MVRPSTARPAACLAVAVFIAAGAAWSAEPPKSGEIRYEMTVTPAKGSARTMSQIIYFKGSRARHETTTPQGRIIQIVTPDGIYMMKAGDKTAMRSPMQMPGGGAFSPLKEVEKAKRMGRKVGTEKVGAYQTDIYEQIVQLKGQGMPAGTVSTRYSISPAVPVPVKIVARMPGVQQVLVLKGWRPNAAVPDNLFELPAGTQIREMRRPGGR